MVDYSAQTSIRNLLFHHRGKITIELSDGRILIVPLKYFPEIQRLRINQRKQCTIVDNRTILFRHLDTIYHLDDFLSLEGGWIGR
ncbi:MAG: DUF2442 domain-containing protein [Candidatus Kapaibacterium sp.]